MPNRKKRAQRRRGGAGAMLPVLICLFALAAVVLLVLLVRSDPFAEEPVDEHLPYRYTSAISFVDDATPEPLVVGATATPVVTPTPSPTPTTMPTQVPPLWGDPRFLVTPTPEPTDTPPPATEAPIYGAMVAGGEGTPGPTEDPASYAARLAPTPMPGDYFLPVYDRALRTPDDRAMIAVTIDDCDKVDVLISMVQTAMRYGAKLTLFPTGAALMDNPVGFRTLHNTYGCELENRTYDGGKLDYTLGSGELALQIWRQGIATSYVLGGDYQQHFYRPENRQSSVDQRTHFFLRKLGMKGVASYTSSYLFHDVDYLAGTLANGNIYQFDMSKESQAIFEDFLAEANRKGYKMVTMNELFGLDDNELSSQLTIAKQELPGMEDYQPTYYYLKRDNRASAIYDIQERLLDLGYLVQVPGDHMADGIFGAATSIALSEFQARIGLAATGDADVATQMRLFADDAPAKDASAPIFQNQQ